MTALAGTWRAPAAVVPAVRVPRLGTGWVLFGAALAGYLGLGAHLVFGLGFIDPDAYSRVISASFVFFSRDPHLAAIGFVWPPLPALFELGLIPLTVAWPAVVARGFAAVIMSAIFMAGAVHQLDRALWDFGVSRLARYVLVAAFAFHPMIAYYGANGMSEAPTVFFMVLVARHFARWVWEPAVGPLVIAGLGLAGAYLTRYETALSAVGVGGLVALLTMVRTRGRRSERVDAAIADTAIVLAPFGLAFAGWALASWLIVGAPFQQFTSIYGNTAQVSVAVAQGEGEWSAPLAAKAALELRRLGGVDIALPSAIGIAALIAWRRRDDRWLAVLAALGPPLAFMVYGYLTNSVFPYFRFLILAVPLAVMLLGLGAAGIANRTVPAQVGPLRRRAHVALGAVTTASLALAALVSVPAAGAAMLDGSINVAQSWELPAIARRALLTGERPAAGRYTFATAREIATYLDGLDLPDGSVLLDVFEGFPIVGNSARPRQFVITADRDFRAALADPISFRVRYLLVPARSGNGTLDAVNLAYPGLWEGGAGFATVERTFAGSGPSSDWRLYRVVSP